MRLLVRGALGFGASFGTGRGGGDRSGEAVVGRPRWASRDASAVVGRLNSTPERMRAVPSWREMWHFTKTAAPNASS